MHETFHKPPTSWGKCFTGIKIFTGTGSLFGQIRTCYGIGKNLLYGKQVKGTVLLQASFSKKIKIKKRTDIPKAYLTPD